MARIYADEQFPRAVLTLNRRHFIRLHSLQQEYSGIIVCKGGGDLEKLADNIRPLAKIARTCSSAHPTKIIFSCGMGILPVQKFD